MFRRSNTCIVGNSRVVLSNNVMRSVIAGAGEAFACNDGCRPSVTGSGVTKHVTSVTDCGVTKHVTSVTDSGVTKHVTSVTDCGVTKHVTNKHCLWITSNMNSGEKK